MEFGVRRATVDDGMALGAMHVEAWHETYPHLLSERSFARATPEARGRRWVELLEAGTADTFVALSENGEIIGHCSCGPAEPGAPRDLEVFSIYLLAKAYGSGAGQRLLDATLGSRPACLWVAAENPRAQAFYRRNGFEEVGEPAKREFLLDTIVELRMVR